MCCTAAVLYLMIGHTLAQVEREDKESGEELVAQSGLPLSRPDLEHSLAAVLSVGENQFCQIIQYKYGGQQQSMN